MIKVEVGQYRENTRGGALKASFSLVIYPEAQKILDCKYFVTGDKRWFKFPDKLIKSKDGTKDEYIPYISYGNKTYLSELQAAVLKELFSHETKSVSEIDCPF